MAWKKKDISYSMFSYFFFLFTKIAHLIAQVCCQKFHSNSSKTIRLNIEQVSFSKEFLKAICKKFHSNSFPDHHFVVSPMTAQGFLSGWYSRYSPS